MNKLKKNLSSKKKNILFISGTRADFSKIKSLVIELQKIKKFNIDIFVTGMHMLKKYGYTVNEIQRSGILNIYKFQNQSNNNNCMSKTISKTILLIKKFLQKKKIHLIIVHGDRLEALAGAITGAFSNILVGHIEGGELSGTIDDSIRHSISKLSHYHFVSNLKSKKRLLQLGENKNSIYVIGSPDLDIMRRQSLPTLYEAKKLYDINFTKYNILIFHSVTTDRYENKKNISLIKKILSLNYNFIVIYPNNDPGSEDIFRLYKSFDSKKIKIYPSMRFEYFLTILKNAKCIIGNSSTGIKESPYLGIPSINIGTRQKNRVGKSKLIFNHNSSNTTNVIKKIDKFYNMSRKIKIKESNFGGGDSFKKIKKILLKDIFWEKNIQKKFYDFKD